MPCLLRRAAALLASLALLAVPARGVLACEMASAAPAESVAGHDHSAMSHHDVSRAQEQPSTAAQAGTPSDGPANQHPQCDHLVGCAPLALSRGTVLVTAVMSVPARDVPFVADGAESPARSLEPPPPKR